MIKAILFDIDNTLVDFMKMKQKSVESAIDAMISAGLKMNKKEAIKTIEKLYDKYGIEYYTIFQKFLKKVKGKIDYRLLAYGILAYRKMQDSYIVPYSNVRSTLLELKKRYCLAIVSDAPIMKAWMRLVEMRLDDFFEVIVTKGDAKRQKTHFAPFRVALKKLNIKPEEALMVGDRIERDVYTAKKLGIKTCFARYGVNKPPKPGKSGANFEINDISELLRVLDIEKV
ncbi:MAG: HAD-IA family hydrolase [Nanoarchaeota archaeon]|nr:HAD-IA family hydrolase [Nanoarchaeota archaeon]